MPFEDAKAAKVKEEETAEADDNSLGSIVQARKKNHTNAASLTSKSRPKDAKTKFEEYDDDDFETPVKGKSSSLSRPKAAKVKKENEDGDDDHKPISKKNSASKVDKLKELSKKKRKEEEEKKGSVVAQQNGKKKEKKVYDMPGQKRDPPQERDPIRIFYETLYQQLPNSEMAQIWMMESGLLSKEDAMKVYEKKQKKNQQKLTSPIKAVTTKKTQSATFKKKTPSPPVSSIKKKTTDPKVETKQSKKRKTADGSNKEDSDEDFIVSRSSKKQRAS